MNFYKEIQTVLEADDVKKKVKGFEEFYKDYKSNSLEFEHTSAPKEFKEPSYSSFCRVVPARDVPKRTNLDTKEGKANLLHALAHIEYSAIDLALDACYRFRNLPKDFYDDWLSVANDETRHFLMLEELLGELGFDYGDIPVHNSLFEAMQKTSHSLLERMAVVPRYLEANGLDATPVILKKLKNIKNDKFIEKIINVLEIILEEEIDHVQKGDRWFLYACKTNSVKKSIYMDIISKYYPNGFARLKEINKDARLKAGFSCSELKNMVKKDVC